MVYGVSNYEVYCNKYGMLKALDLTSSKSYSIQFNVGGGLIKFVYSDISFQEDPPYELYFDGETLKALNTITGNVYDVVLEECEDEERS